jgi:hypothetical protein
VIHIVINGLDAVALFLGLCFHYMFELGDQALSGFLRAVLRDKTTVDRTNILVRLQNDAAKCSKRCKRVGVLRLFLW